MTRLFVLILAMLASLAIGCKSTSTDSGNAAGTSELIRDMGQEAERVAASANALRSTIDAMTPANVEAQKPLARSQTSDIAKGAKRIIDIAPEAQKTAQADQDAIAQLRAEQEKSSAVATLTRWATWSFGLAALIGMAWAFLRWRQLLVASLAAGVLGVLFLIFAQIARTAAEVAKIATWSVAIVGGVWLAVAVWLFIHRLRKGMSVENAAKSTIENLIPGNQFGER